MKKISSLHTTVLPTASTYARPFLALALVVLILGYGLFQARTLIQGPTLTLLSPSNGSSVSDSLVEIVGQAAHVSEIALNDRAIVIDEEGMFREHVLLGEGYNIMTLEARDRFGREVSSTLEIVYQ